MFLGSLRVQTSQDFIQILGLFDDLIGTGISVSTQQFLRNIISGHPVRTSKTILALNNHQAFGQELVLNVCTACRCYRTISSVILMSNILFCMWTH